MELTVEDLEAMEPGTRIMWLEKGKSGFTHQGVISSLASEWRDLSSLSIYIDRQQKQGFAYELSSNDWLGKIQLTPNSVVERLSCAIPESIIVDEPRFSGVELEEADPGTKVTILTDKPYSLFRSSRSWIDPMGNDITWDSVKELIRSANYKFKVA